MAMDVGKKNGGAMAEINVTPLVDIVLVLLIIFMVLTPSMLKHLTGTVPEKADDGDAPRASNVIVVEYTAKRELTVNTEPVAPEALAAALSKRLQSRRQKVVFFRAEDAAPYGEVVRLMDIARGAGAETLALATQQ